MDFRNFLLAALPHSDVEALAPDLKELNLRRGQVLYEPGDVPDLIYFPGSACISVVEIMEDGRAYETATIGRESATSLLESLLKTPLSTRQSAQIAGSAMSLPASTFR